MSIILVIDDNSQNLALAEAALEDEGLDVVLASSGQAGVAAFEQHKPDCVLLDIRMPGMDGFEVCNKIRSLPQGEETPIVFLTASRDVDTFDRALLAGADDFLTKPVLPTELVVRVQAALKLRRLGSDLREQVALVRTQRDDLMRLQLQKERLTAFVVHDLKNPLNSMDLHAQLLQRDKQLSERSVNSVKHIRSEARTLQRLIMNLLDIAKGEEGELVPRPESIELQAFLDEVVDGLALSASRAGVKLELRVASVPVAADPALLRRVFENLVENAIRHAPEGSTIHLTGAKDEDGVEVRVVDRGPGIPEAMVERVFERFVQLDAANSRGGRGLGLTFCKLAIEAHNGRIWIEDASPGASFCIRLPSTL